MKNIPQDKRNSVARWAIKTLILLIVFGAVLMLSAGRWDWTAGWVYLGLLLVTQAVSAAVLLTTQPELLAERSQLQPGTKVWDKYLSTGMALFGPLAIFIVAGLDARFGWAGPFSAPVRAAGLLLSAAGSLFLLWAMTANAFFAATVRIQHERGHRVAQGGPYRWVRHPGYLGAILFNLAAPFALGTPWALLPAALTVAVIAVRTAFEDRTLREELPGYHDYARRVPHRLLPGIW